MFDLKESGEGSSLSERGRGRSLHAEGPKTKTEGAGTSSESLVRGIWWLRVSAAERRVWEGVLG